MPLIEDHFLDFIKKVFTLDNMKIKERKLLFTGKAPVAVLKKIETTQIFFPRITRILTKCHLFILNATQISATKYKIKGVWGAYLKGD